MKKQSSERRGFRISDDYKTSTVWFFTRDGLLTGTIKTRIDKGKSRRERYDLQLRALSFCDIATAKVPPFKASARKP